MTQLFGWHRLLNSLNIPLSVETVCVFTAPIFSVNASWATYLLTKVVFLLLKTHVLNLDYWSSLVISLLFLQETKGPGAGLMAATILAMVIVILTMYFFFLKNTRCLILCLIYIFFFCSSIFWGSSSMRQLDKDMLALPILSVFERNSWSLGTLLF